MEVTVDINDLPIGTKIVLDNEQKTEAVIAERRFYGRLKFYRIITKASTCVIIKPVEILDENKSAVGAGG